MNTLRAVLMTVLLAVLLTAVGSALPAVSAPLTASPATSGTDDGPTYDVAADTLEAQATLADLAAKYRLLDDATVVLGFTPDDMEAVAYYTEGQIVINTAHSVSIATILKHEVWHVIDWRDNGRIDWGEDLPPDNSDAYLK